MTMLRHGRTKSKLANVNANPKLSPFQRTRPNYSTANVARTISASLEGFWLTMNRTCDHSQSINNAGSAVSRSLPLTEDGFRKCQSPKWRICRDRQYVDHSYSQMYVSIKTPHTPKMDTRLNLFARADQIEWLNGSGGNKRGQKWRFDGGQWRDQRGQSSCVLDAGRFFA